MHLRRSYHLGERLARIERTLRARRDRLALAAAAGEEISAAGAWLLDHYSYLHTLAVEIRDAVPREYYRYLERVSGGEARVYTLAAELVARTGALFEVEGARAFWEERQEGAVFTLAEVWAIGPMLKTALLETVAQAGDDENLTANAITTLRLLGTTNWREMAESLSAVERILRQDPAGVYPRMDFETRDAYRHTVEGIARASRKPETGVAELALELARRDGIHLGVFLQGDGLRELRRRAGFHRPAGAAARELVRRFPNFFYLGLLALVTAALVAVIARLLAAPWWAAALIVLPASQAAMAVVHPLVNRFLTPRRLPRMDFSEGIPDDCRTFVVVPTLLLSRTGVERLLENLEIHYLANRDPNLLFALLTDFPDAQSPEGPQDSLLEFCAEGIRRLNERHASEEHAPFYLFHRPRQWNASEGAWMGWERKRGKLADFNRYLLGERNNFSAIEGDAETIGEIRYVITLDSDTQLPLDTARKLVATMAHPLNRPRFDPLTNLVRQGYALMQPRISISTDSACRSQLARIFSGQTGFDPYTTAVSDVYQDLYGRASFTGKGIYDLRAFERATESRFPENTLLSHDLIEGEHVRTALVTDLEFIDDYPSSYEAYSKRKHRWVRGDWQVAMWALPWAPDAHWRWRRNALPLISRWKILDNLRRSLMEISLVAMIFAGWWGLGGGWLLAAVALLAFPAWAELAMAFLRVPPPRFWATWISETGYRFAQGHFEALFYLVFLAHQALAMADAVVRTLVRRVITHRRLLEWESAAQAEAAKGKRRSLMTLYLYSSPVVAVAGAAAVRMSGHLAEAATVAVLELWIFAPLIARWVDSALPKQRGITVASRAFLRDVALQTWRYFTDFCRAEENWLVPDNVQEDPPAEAHTISPTNLGLLLNANQAAHDFGYLTVQEAVERTERTLRAMARLPRCRGHLYNWYDTRTLLPVLPHYVSSVDSGNLAASLVALKQGCLEQLRRPIVDFSVLEGLRDHALRLVNALADDERTAGITKLTEGLQRQLDYRPTELFFWESVLTEAAKSARRLCEHAGRAATRMERRAPWDAAEVRYWAAALDARAEAAARDLFALAPWLHEPFEAELRMRGGDPTLEELLAALSRVPEVSKLPAHYDMIGEKLRERLATGPVQPALAAVLEGLRDALPKARRVAERLIHRLEEQAAMASGYLEEMNFAFLFDPRRKLLRVGHDVGAGRPDEGYYDLLASEARSAVFLAIAKGDVPREAWFRLGRKLTAWRGRRVLLSWSGTMFEYLMPALFMEAYNTTVLGQSVRAVVDIQRLYAGEHNVPWGISESAYSARDSAMRYQYYAFGVPAIALKRRVRQELVVAPYASALALMVNPAAATANLRQMAQAGWRGRYGFYEAVEFTAGLARQGTPVRSFMSHHQGMTLLALDNALHSGPMRKRFHAEPMVQATAYLLEERLPVLLDIVKDEEPGPVAVRTVRRQQESSAG